VNDQSPPERGPLVWAMATASLTIIAARQLFPSIDADTGSGSLFVLAAFTVGILALVDLVMRNGPTASIPVFVFLIALSSATAAYNHPSLYMLGEWTGVLCVWAALRRSAGPQLMKQIVLLIVVLAIGESLLTWHQVSTVIPDLLERFRRGDVGMMRDLAQVGVEPGFMFQSRLEARLPWGTFGHTNTLAGFLMFASPFLLTMAASAWSVRPSAQGWIARGLSLLLLGLLLFGLALTKGRSAWIGTAVAFGIVGLGSPSVRRILLRHWTSIIAAGAVVLAVFLWKGGNAVESLRYRFEYWQGTLPIIKEHPWLGVGWGNFRDHYLEHKLVYSSEEIADPHNFFMEFAACAGIPAAIAYLFWVAVSLRRLLRSPEDAAGTPRSSVIGIAALGTVLSVAALVVVGLGYSSSWSEIGAWGLAIAFPVVLLLDRLTPQISAKSWRIATAAAVVGLHVHLLAAGGVGHPGMMLACWGVAAAAVGYELADSRKRLRDLGLLLAILIIGVTSGMISQTKRTLERDPVLARLRNVREARFLTDEAVARGFDRALVLTPRDADLWAEKARWLRHRLADPGGGGLQQQYPLALAAFDRAIELQPLRSQFWLDRGMLKLEGASRNLTPFGNAVAATADFRQAVARYPNSPARQSDEAFALAAVSQESKTAAGLGQALDDWRMVKNSKTSAEVGERLGRQSAAGIEPASRKKTRDAARRALELDAATPHFDKKLPPAERAWLGAVADELKGRGAEE
jgi:O-antigen ligase